ncbi:hypothetical protein T484DRAFT_1801590, partial [Baffinella frigidus]
MHDADDEVRDRSTFYGVRDRSTFYGAVLASDSEPLLKKYIIDVNPMKLAGVEKALSEYREGADFSAPFNFARAVVAPLPASPSKGGGAKAGG